MNRKTPQPGFEFPQPFAKSLTKIVPMGFSYPILSVLSKKAVRDILAENGLLVHLKAIAMPGYATVA